MEYAALFQPHIITLAIPGLDNINVRKAIAMAVDYDTIIANAMTNTVADIRPGAALHDEPDSGVNRLCMTRKPLLTCSLPETT